MAGGIMRYFSLLGALGLLACGENSAGSFDQNSGAPTEVSAEELCSRLEESGCPQGETENCVENHRTMGVRDENADCDAQINELRRCYYIDLPADIDAEIDFYGTCVLSTACETETDAVCRCERGDLCDVDS